MGYAWLNVMSLLLGLIAWAIPLTAICFIREGKKGVLSIWLSMSTCVLSLLSAMFYQRHLVNIGDWSALMDTIQAFVLAATTLSVITLLLKAVVIITRK